MEIEDLETKRAKLKSWLALRRMSRKDFAKQIGMSFTSINGWFSNTNIPDKKWQEIKALFEAENKPAKQPVFRVVAFAVPEEDHEMFCKAAETQDLSVEEFVRQSSLEAVKKLLSGE